MIFQIQKVLTITLCAFVFVSCTSDRSSSRSHEHAQNGILFIIDGMGPAHITAARIFKNNSDTPLAMESMEHLAMARTHSTNNFVTDSAASATALASGVKTYNGAIGMTDANFDPSETSQKIQSITDLSLESNRAVGIVTNTRITHATPAAFFAHVPHRRLEAEIARQLATRSEIDLVIGGGLEFFLPKEEGGERVDGLNLIEKMREQGRKVVTSHEEFKQLNPREINQNLVVILEFDHLAYEFKRADEEVSLSQITDFSIEFLEQRGRSKSGYFLMVEAGRVDHASHMNWTEKMLEDMVEADRSIETILSKTQDSNDTLVIVTADHETGGLSLQGYASHSAVAGRGLLKNHSRDVRQDAYVYGVVSWGSGPGYDSPLEADADNPKFRHKATYPTPVAYHTAVDIPTLAHGPGAFQINGYIDNTDIFRAMKNALKLID